MSSRVLSDASQQAPAARRQLSVIFGIVMFAQPGAGALAVIWVIGTYAVFFGVLLIGLGARLKRHAPGASHGRESHA